MEKELIDFFNKMKDNIKEQTGYILLPDIDGFKVFEIPKSRLEKYVTVETLSKSIDSPHVEAPKVSKHEQAKEYFCTYEHDCGCQDQTRNKCFAKTKCHWKQKCG